MEFIGSTLKEEIDAMKKKTKLQEEGAVSTAILFEPEKNWHFFQG